MEAEGVCPPNLAQGTSEELSFRFGWGSVLPCGRDTGAVGVMASPVFSPNGLLYVGSSDRQGPVQLLNLRYPLCRH